MGNPYPVEITDDAGEARLTGLANFTDAQNQPGGGSQTVERIYFPFAWDTADLVLTGIPIYTPAPGDVIAPYAGSLYGGDWDGDTPTFHLGYAADLSAYDTALAGPFVLSGAPSPAVGPHAIAPAANSIPSTNPWQFTDAEPLTAMIDDGSGGDPGNASGVGLLVLLVYKAA